MNLRLLLSGLFSLFAAAVLVAEPLTRDASVYARPEPGAPVLRTLRAGSTPTPATESAPTGWLAIQVEGPHDLFIDNKDVGKNLDAKIGAAFRLQPDAAAPVVATMEAGDKAELAGLRGDWTMYKVEKPIVGFIKLAGPVPAATATTTAPVVAAPVVRTEGGQAGIPRFFEGRFAPTRNFLTYKHPYNFQLLDATGTRFAYLDVSRLLLTENIDRYFDRLVIVYGTVRVLEGEGRKGRVIEVESLHLK